MAFGVATNCINCKFLGSQIFLNAKKEHICAECIQKEHDKAIDNVQRSFDEMYKLKQQIEGLVAKIEFVKNIDWNIIFSRHVDQIKEALMLTDKPKIEEQNV